MERMVPSRYETYDDVYDESCEDYALALPYGCADMPELQHSEVEVVNVACINYSKALSLACSTLLCFL